jgi:hypothetical protein
VNLLHHHIAFSGSPEDHPGGVEEEAVGDIVQVWIGLANPAEFVHRPRPFGNAVGGLVGCHEAAVGAELHLHQLSVGPGVLQGLAGNVLLRCRGRHRRNLRRSHGGQDEESRDREKLDCLHKDLLVRRAPCLCLKLSGYSDLDKL